MDSIAFDVKRCHTFLMRVFLSPRPPVSVAPAPCRPFDALQDSQLFDAECSEPLLPLPAAAPAAAADSAPCGQGRPGHARGAPEASRLSTTNGSGARRRARGTEEALLYGVGGGGGGVPTGP